MSSQTRVQREPSGAGEFVIRRAVPSDMSQVGLLGALLVRTHHEFDPQRFIAATSQTADGYGSFLGTQLNEPKVIVLVAERVSTVVGYAYAGLEGRDYMSLRGPAGVLYDIVVDPSVRKGGIGAALLRAAVTQLEQLGAPRVLLSTAEQNDAAQRLFARSGFRRTMIEMTREAGAWH